MSTEQQHLTKKERIKLKQQNKEAVHEQRKAAKKTQKNFVYAFLVLATLLVIFGLWKSSPEVVTEAISPATLLQVQSDDWVKGNPGATVTLIEYLDFECGACGAYYPLVQRLVNEYGDRVHFITRYFPLPGHKNGMNSALAVESAGMQGKYWEMQDLLFREQESWGNSLSPNPSLFTHYANQLGLNMEQFAQDTNSSEVKNRVARDRDSGNKLGVNATPTFFLNGKKLENPRGYEAFKALLDDALKQ